MIKVLMEDLKIPRAEEAFLKTHAHINPAQRKRDEAYDEDMQKCLTKLAEVIQKAIPEGEFNAYLRYEFRDGPMWANFSKDLAKRLGELNYRVSIEKKYKAIKIQIRWDVTFWDKLFGRKPAQLALPLLPPEELN